VKSHKAKSHKNKLQKAKSHKVKHHKAKYSNADHSTMKHHHVVHPHHHINSKNGGRHKVVIDARTYKKKPSHVRLSPQVREREKYRSELEEVRKEIAKVVVGNKVVIDSILKSLLANGHVLIEGVPGVAKTLLIRALAESSGCKFSRIQFTVDMLPADISGITTYNPKKGFETIKGPVFANFIIADEINRAPPKTQSALLEAMQEKQVTIGKNTFKLDLPFFVMANHNPIESSGTYKLPEAQIDRFLFKLKMGYPEMEEEEEIIDQNISTHKFEEFKIKPILSPSKIKTMQRLTKEINISKYVKKYIVSIIDATRNPDKYSVKHGKYIEWGASPRASISLGIGARADAFLRGDESVTPQNVKNVAHDVLRHRILLNYAGQAENIDTDKMIDEILSKVKIP
jgi:MoxR-like ATPase